MSTVSALVRSVSGFSDCSVTVGNSFTPTRMNKIVTMFYCFSWKGRWLKQTTKVTFNLQHGRPIYLTSPTCLLFNETKEEGCILWQLVHLLSANCLWYKESQAKRGGMDFVMELVHMMLDYCLLFAGSDEILPCVKWGGARLRHEWWKWSLPKLLMIPLNM